MSPQGIITNSSVPLSTMMSSSVFQLIVLVSMALNFAVLAHSHRAVTSQKALKPAVPAQNHMADNVRTI